MLQGWWRGAFAGRCTILVDFGEDARGRAGDEFSNRRHGVARLFACVWKALPNGILESVDRELHETVWVRTLLHMDGLQSAERVAWDGVGRYSNPDGIPHHLVQAGENSVHISAVDDSWDGVGVRRWRDGGDSARGPAVVGCPVRATGREETDRQDQDGRWQSVPGHTRCISLLFTRDKGRLASSDDCPIAGGLDGRRWRHGRAGERCQRVGPEPHYWRPDIVAGRSSAPTRCGTWRDQTPGDDQGGEGPEGAIASLTLELGYGRGPS